MVVRYVPALLEIGVLTRLKIDAGARYAIATLVRYLLIGVGVALTFGALSIGWSSIQWLAAALTFGLAFGLQEIFANFISGLILLVERPIRVGDTVTVGSVQGTVARIRTRATTILDYDNREHLIPNKSLITGSVINWTLTEAVTRIVVPVGVGVFGFADAGRVYLDGSSPGGWKTAVGGGVFFQPVSQPYLVRVGAASSSESTKVFMALGLPY